MTIGILYICTGKYSIFWKSFHDSSEAFFMPDVCKQYYVFTDDKSILPTDTIHIYYKEPMGFPLDSLLRFDLFDRIAEDTKVCDYLFFFNSNMKFVKTVTPSMMLPSKNENGLVAVLHPGYFNSSKFVLPYEKHARSKAYIPFRSEGDFHYFMGGVNGGTYNDYMRLIRTCKQNIQEDTDNHVLAIYHDESHLNCYLHGKHIKILPSTFGAPEDSKIIKDPYIIVLNKIKHGGKYFDKLPKKSYGKRLKFFIKRLYWNTLWSLGILK